MTIRRISWPAALAPLLLAMVAGSPGAAQELLLSADPMAQARAAMARNDPAEALSRYLRVLSGRPKDLEALIGAGRAALEIGDPNAAIGFFARAEEVAPRNARVKAGLGSAMLQMEKAKAALRLFEEAEDLGIPPEDIAADRGLAHDLRGDNRRAQQEYALAQRTRDDPETRRRLALSMAMSGDRAGALAVLDPLLRKQDVPAWRARAFVLALTGDIQGAESVALSVMPRPQATALLPFLARLPSLKQQQQAAAVHFGHFPSDGRRYSDAELLAGAQPMARPGGPRSDSGLVPSGAPLGRGGTISAPAPDAPEPAAPRRRPGSAEDKPTTTKAIASYRQTESARMQAVAAALRDLPPIDARITPPAKKPAAEPGFVMLPEKPARTPVAGTKLAVAPKDKLELKPVEAAKDGAGKDKAKAGASDKAKDSKVKDAKDAKAGKAKDDAKAAKEKASERYWVQVAGGANKADLPKAYAKLQEKSPKLLAGRTAWTTKLRATNRLLIGPFKTAEEAQIFVNKAGKEALPAFSYTSPVGQQVEKLPAK